MTKRTVSVYITRRGAQVRLTDRQVKALQRERGGAWSQLMYTFMYVEYAEPSYKDAEIARMLANCEGKTHIGMLHPQYRHPELSFIVANPDPNGPYAGCATFEAAVTCAFEHFRCSIVTVSARDYAPEFDGIAEAKGIILLVI